MTTSPTSRVASTSGSVVVDRPHRGLQRAASLFCAAPRPLVILVAAAIALRLFEMVVYSTVITDYYTGDSGRFIRFGYPGIFYDEWQPAGYALFLAAVRGIWNALPVTVALQHLMGLGTGLLLYAAARRADAGKHLALIPAALVLLSGDNLFLEQSFLTETLWTVLLAAAVYAGVRAGATGSVRWLIAASSFMGLSIIVRNVSMLLPLVLAVWAAVLFAGPLKSRLVAAASAVLPAAAVVMVYLIVASALGPYTGMGEMSGWALYARVAQFADCSQFTPPKGTQGLCEARPVGERPGPLYYYFDPSAPAHKVFPAMDVADGKHAGAFARQAILHQPLDYVRTVVKDTVRYFDPNAGFDRVLSGSGPDAMSFREKSPDPANTAMFADKVRSRYSDVDSTPDRGTAFLETWQTVFRLNGLLLLALLALSVAGIWRATGLARATVTLCTSIGVVLLVLPPAVSQYDARYTIPPAGILAVSAALGFGALVARHAAGANAAPASDATR